MARTWIFGQPRPIYDGLSCRGLHLDKETVHVISSHFASPIRATPAEFKAAFGAVFGDGSAPRLEEADWESLDGLNKLIEDNSLGSPLKASYR